MPKTPIAIRTPHSHDVLFGRGAGTNSHPGNQRFLQWIWELSVKYHGVARRDKNNVCQKVIDLVHLQDPPGRFLQQTGNGQERKWNVVDETESLLLLSKVGQAFRDLKRDLRQNSNSRRISSPGLQAEECAGIGRPIQPSWHSYSRHQSAGGLRQPVLKRFNNRHPGAPYALSVAPEHPVGLRPYHRHVYNKHSSSSK
ncbi:expressed unknown protein [Seminavis robusta]|uniref:DUF6824 domain-containing protein n=1 Tax=Seminavis robusta TaxID=568900 RepID=A0A9N8EKV0_9STRA|nr:expressed unknown protein [Seminavis robusta]|eukprot:Sro1147_g246420.1 n/a (198) ;mRNA; r:33024-33617